MPRRVARLARALDGPLTGPLTELLIRAFAPRQVLGEEFASIYGIDAAYAFGSWATGYAGHRGAAPNNIDVLVIGTARRIGLHASADRASARLAREVNPILRFDRLVERRGSTRSTPP